MHLYPLHYGADGDVKLTESAVVAEYVDNAYPDSGPKIFPTDPLKLALVRLGSSLQVHTLPARKQSSY